MPNTTLTGNFEILRHSDTSGGCLFVADRIYVGDGDGGYVDIAEKLGSAGIYEHLQSEPATRWTIVHQLGTKTPQIDVFVGDRLMIAETDYASATENRIELHFVVPVSGRAIVRR